MKKYEAPVHVENGSIYTMAGNILENPAIVIDHKTGTLLCWGDAGYCQAKYNALLDACAKTRLYAPDYTLVFLSNMHMTREQQCYILRRCIEYTASGFHTALVDHLAAGDGQEWLTAEMERVPIDVH